MTNPTHTFLGLPWPVWLEGAVLVLTAPFLLFPTVKPTGTVVALCLLAVNWAVQITVNRRSFAPTPFGGALLLWAAMVAAGILVTAFPDLTLPKATGLLLGMATWLFLSRAVTDRRTLRWAVVGLIGFGIAITAVGLVSVRWPDKVPFVSRWVEIGLPTNLVEIPEGPESGVSANQLAGTLVFYLTLTLSILLAGRGAQGRWWIARAALSSAAAGALTVLLLLTQSRSGWMGAVLGALLLLALWGLALPRSRRRRAVWALCALGILGICLGAAAIGPERLQALWQEPTEMTALGSLGTLGFRQEVWRWALMATQDFLFTGCGLGTFRGVGRLLYPLNVAPGYDIAHAHNIFLQVALDVGVPGLIAYVALLGIAAWLGLRIARRDATLRPLALGLVGGLGALHIYGMMDVLAPGSKPGLVFWVALGLLAAMHRLAGNEET